MNDIYRLGENHNMYIKQRRELAELLGFETRNKYEIQTENGAVVGFAAEQNKSWIGFLLRQFFGHWRSFELHFFDSNRLTVLVAKHPFRFFFQRLEVYSPEGRFLGALQRRFEIFSKKFEVQGVSSEVLMEVSSPIWKIWTFPFKRQGRELATVSKKWGGLLKEAFLDSDSFQVKYSSPDLKLDERYLILAAGIYIDLMYFEQKS